jgi:hypothetical protein
MAPGMKVDAAADALKETHLDNPAPQHAEKGFGTVLCHSYFAIIDLVV